MSFSIFGLVYESFLFRLDVHLLFCTLCAFVANTSGAFNMNAGYLWSEVCWEWTCRGEIVSKAYIGRRKDTYGHFHTRTYVDLSLACKLVIREISGVQAFGSWVLALLHISRITSRVLDLLTSSFRLLPFFYENLLRAWEFLCVDTPVN